MLSQSDLLGIEHKVSGTMCNLEMLTIYLSVGLILK